MRYLREVVGQLIRRYIGVIIVGGAALFVLWFFVIRSSALTVETGQGTYSLPVPRTWFLRGESQVTRASLAGTVNATLHTGHPPTTMPRMYGLFVAPVSTAVTGGRPGIQAVKACMQAGAEALDGQMVEGPATMVTIAGEQGLESQFFGRQEGYRFYGRIRGVARPGEVAVFLLQCPDEACRDDPEMTGFLDRFQIGPPP